jgi:hypothetical protein
VIVQTDDGEDSLSSLQPLLKSRTSAVRRGISHQQEPGDQLRLLEERDDRHSASSSTSACPRGVREDSELGQSHLGAEPERQCGLKPTNVRSRPIRT